MHNQSACGMGSMSVYYVINVYDSYKYTSQPFYIKLWDWSSKSSAHGRFRAGSTGRVVPAVTRGLLRSRWRRYGYRCPQGRHPYLRQSPSAPFWVSGDRLAFSGLDQSADELYWSLAGPWKSLFVSMGSKASLGEYFRYGHVWSDSLPLVRWFKRRFNCPINISISQPCYPSVLV